MSAPSSRRWLWRWRPSSCCERGGGGLTVLPVLLPSFPRKRESGGGWQVCGIIRQYRRDSRLRGNDGRGRRAAGWESGGGAGGNEGLLPSFPRKRESGGGWQVCGIIRQYRRDSRLRGNDGGAGGGGIGKAPPDSRLRGKDGGAGGGGKKGGGMGEPLRDSRLRGKDGGEAGRPFPKLVTPGGRQGGGKAL